MHRLPVAAAALWWCSLSVIGFLVVPLLFSHLPSPALAGGTAARLFAAQTWISCACGLVLLVYLLSNKALARMDVAWKAIIFVAVGVVFSMLAEFVVSPRIVARENLRLWHGLGSAMFVLQWLCAVVTYWLLTGPSQHWPQPPSHQV